MAHWLCVAIAIPVDRFWLPDLRTERAISEIGAAEQFCGGAEILETPVECAANIGWLECGAGSGRLPNTWGQAGQSQHRRLVSSANNF